MAKQGFFEQHWSDDVKRPAGGVSSGRGFTISWQNGPLGKAPHQVPPNGAFVEDVIAAAIGRIEFYQASEFACEANLDALNHLKLAAIALDNRTKDRTERQVEGTHSK